MLKSLVAGLIVFLLGACTPETNHSAMMQSAVFVKAGSGHGSGVVIGPSIVLTAAHVAVNGDVSVIVNGETIAAKVVMQGTGEDADFAVLKLSHSVDVPIAKISCREVPVGEQIYAVGWPLNGLPSVLVSGKVLSHEDVGGEYFRFTDANFIMGMSGGPVYDAEGNVVGIVHGMIVTQYGMPGLNIFAAVQPLCKSFGVE